MPKLSVELSEFDHKQLKAKAAWLALTQAEIVRRFLRAWFDREIELPGDKTDELLDK